MNLRPNVPAPIPPITMAHLRFSRSPSVEIEINSLGAASLAELDKYPSPGRKEKQRQQSDTTTVSVRGTKEFASLVLCIRSKPGDGPSHPRAA